MTRFRWTCSQLLRLGVAVLALNVVNVGAAIDKSLYKRFYGVYTGEAVVNTDGELTNRDLKVEISDHEEGFNVTWMVVSYKAGGKVKRKEYSINFEPTPRKGIYRSAMRQNVFGQQIPLDPLGGDPYVWARIEAETLMVYAMLILDDGGYEIQHYVRTLTDDGMDLEYKRVRNGEILRTVSGKLNRH